jgi:hypothetical protein
VVELALLLGLGSGIAGCGGGDNGVTPISASFVESGTAAGPDVVRITGTSVGSIVKIDLSIGGPTSSDDLFAFVFDLQVEDESVVELVDGSATAGAALDPDYTQQIELLVVQTGNRIKVGITKRGASNGNGVSEGEALILSLRLRVLRRESVRMTIAGSPPNGPAALDSTGATIPSVWFDSRAAVISGT